uniref:Uncharacterized protein n=1 Tax=Rhizophora mucronata TaxID=61149 RepID=A0A2P2IKU8_RHIMU
MSTHQLKYYCSFMLAQESLGQEQIAVGTSDTENAERSQNEFNSKY